ncbi:hypothetical protein BGZ51_006527 [Haplosporangium sp. Z 767]|nr:hypothetical protein BGZ50_006570 [Haplosporangium sp. Z 11]KAF9179981.1 hypothetical protein BGZ51_006527 [Haplosporangium sp. Z 767]
MKFTSILSLAVALCVVTVNAAPADKACPTTTVVAKSAKTSKAKPTTTTTTAKPKVTKTKAKTTTTTTKKPKKTTTTKAKVTTTKATTTKATTTKVTTKATTKATSTTKPTPSPVAPKKDPCSTLATQAKDYDSILSFNAVRDCYLAQPYNADVATKTLKGLESLIGNFYVFLDQAKEKTSSPFKTSSVDLMAGLRKIRSTKYKRDYDFSMALTYLTFSVNDGHLAFRSDCYKTATFIQPISLYAPVVNGKQDIRVFYADAAEKGVPKTHIVDCVVNTIDGVPALKAVQDFTDRTSAISKDPGVRLNDALASTSWYNEWGISPGGFSKRWELPQKSSMEYEIQCGTAAPQKVTVPWIVKPSDYFEFNTFTDTKTYWSVQCAATPSPYSNSRSRDNMRAENNDIGYRINIAPGTTLFRERGSIALPKGGRNGRNGGTPELISKATEVLLTATTAFYRLKRSDACVAVIASEEAAYFKFDSSDYLQFIQGLEMLRDGGCKKLILDMTNNGGGSVDFAYFINMVFFPKAKPYFVEDLRSNSFVQNAARAAIKTPNVVSTFDARGYVDMATDKVYKDHSMFTKGVNYKRGGTTSTYTQKNYFEFGWPFMPLDKNRTMPWKASDMAIVTNGFCGSACTMIATRFNIEHKVKTYAIGGIHKRPLSYFTFPGGFVMDNESIVSDLQKIKFKAAGSPSDLPIKAMTMVAVGEIYATENSKVPLEYDAKYFSANVHLDHDLVTARNPDDVWLKIAADFKK